jgi:hypothetical protein
VANLEDENRDFEQFDLPDGDLGEPELLPDLAAADDQEAVPAGDEPLTAELPAGEQEAQAQEEKPEEEAEEKGGFLKALMGAGPYTVMLAVALAAILTACTCLFLELNSYKFDIGASDYTQRAE